MRIVAGQWRGRKLLAPEGDTTRPTADRTRETLFSMLTSRLGSFEGLRVADLFAGSGALGLEALSRGAAHAMFAEQDPKAIRAIRANIANLHAQKECDVRVGSVMALGVAKVPYDLVLLDPPYKTSAGVVAIDKLRRLGWMHDGTWVCIETEAREAPRVRGFEVMAERVVGKACLTLMRPEPSEAPKEVQASEA